MVSEPRKDFQERKETDLSLEVERARTDSELDQREAAIENRSDSIIKLARGRADITLERARELAKDNLLEASWTPEQARHLDREHEQEDATVQQERATADDELSRERERRKLALGSLFRFEREHTDTHLRTERERVDAVLAANNDFLAMVFMQLPTPLCVTRGRDHVFELVNPAFLRLVGRTALLGQSVRAVFPKLEADPFVELMDKVFASGKPFHGDEVRAEGFRPNDGAPISERFFNIMIEPLREQDGRVSGIAIVALEATEQVRARVKARASERRLRFLGDAGAVLGTSLDLAPLLDSLARVALPGFADFCLVDVIERDDSINRVAVAHVDPAKEALLRELQHRFPLTWDSPQPAVQVLRTGQPQLLIELSPQVIASHTQDARHAELIRTIGIRSHITVPMLARGKTVGALGFGLTEPGRQYTPDDLLLARDLAERAAYAVDHAQLYSEARRAISVRDDFLAIASHELKTPLTPILLHLQSLTREVREEQTDKLVPARVGKKLEAISRQVRRLDALVHGLLDLSRLSGQRLSLEIEHVDLSALISEVTARFHTEADQTKTTLKVQVPATLFGDWDRLRLDQVISNLLGNALKFGAGKPIVITATTRGEVACLSVQDSGIGIDRADQARIFQRFERGVPIRQFGGFGLGLWIVSQIIEALGGTISVTSELGHGAIFAVELPLRRPTESA